MEHQATEQQSYEDVQKSGYLLKHKSMHRRFFVLRAASEHGPARLEYYENEKKFRSKSPVPKKALNLETCFNINKRADSKNKHMIVLYTRSESFAIVADSEDVQDEWYQAMLDLQFNCKTPDDCGSSGECGMPSPSPTFKEVWQVKVWPKGLGHARNLVGVHRLCLTDKTVNFVKLNSDVAAVVLQLMNVRRCGHSENFFFIEVGRSAMTGPGEFWMQVDDSVVAQNMHETLLESMKALSEEFRQRSKSQSVGTSSCGGTTSNPISFPSRRHHAHLPPSQVGFSRRARTETPGAGGNSSTSTSPTLRHGFPRARTASIGGRSEEGGACAKGTWASSSPSLNGSCSTTPTLRPKPTRAPTPAKITLSLARYTPNPTPSPAPSLSSSSGHGSECGLVGAAAGGMTICSYNRVPQRVSVSGSPSDYGSSDEYGSSPGEHSLLVPNMSGGSHRGEGSTSYIVMGQREGLLGSHHQRPQGRRILRRSSSRECKAERRLSKRASLPLAAQDRLTPRRKEDDDGDDEYAIMSRTANKENFVSHQGSGGPAAGGRQVNVAGKSKKRADKGRSDEDATGHVDSGYMSMLPGVTAPPPGSLPLSVRVSDAGAKPGLSDDEYMAMTPNNSVSPPQPIRQTASEGYMVMSPNGSCSTDSHGLVTWGSRGSVEGRVGGVDGYVNVSPTSVRSASSTPPSHPPEQHPLQPKTSYSYFSLPRSYQHTLSTRFEDDLSQGKGKENNGSLDGAARCGQARYSKRNRVGPAGGCQLSLSSSSFSSSSASSESLEEKSMSTAVGRGLSLLRIEAEYRSVGIRVKDRSHQQKRVSSSKSPQQQRRGRPLSVSLDMSKANTLPRAKENLLPTAASQSPGDYVSIVYGGDGEYGRGSEHGRSVIHGTLRPSHQTVLCHNGSANLPRSFSAPLATSTEYVSMDSVKLSSPRTPVRSTFSAPQGPRPAVVPKARDERGRSLPVAAEGSPRYRTNTTTVPTDILSPFTDYMATAFGRASDSPAHCSNVATITTMTPAIHSGHVSSMEQEQGFGFSSPEPSGRPVRGDQRGRRCHRSEAFVASPSAPHHSPSSASQVAGHRRGPECLPWENGQPALSSASPAQASSSSSAEQGLNYIDLDLAVRESPQAGVERSSSSSTTSYTVGGGGLGSGSGSNINTYVSIDFYKSEELRTQQSSRKDGQDC